MLKKQVRSNVCPSGGPVALLSAERCGVLSLWPLIPPLRLHIPACRHVHG